MKKIKLLIRVLLSLPKTIIFNLIVFPLNVGLKMPILVSYDTKVRYYSRNMIAINGECNPFMIKINIFPGSDGVINIASKKGVLNIGKGKIIFNGKANFSRGTSIRVDSGVITFGKNFSCNRQCFFSCSEEILIGENVLIGWNTNIRDSDGHDIFDIESNQKINHNKPVVIGNNVWIGSNVDILKGTLISNNCVVGYRSCVTKNFIEENCIIAGYPAKIIKRGIYWRK